MGHAVLKSKFTRSMTVCATPSPNPPARPRPMAAARRFCVIQAAPPGLVGPKCVGDLETGSCPAVRPFTHSLRWRTHFLVRPLSHIYFSILDGDAKCVGYRISGELIGNGSKLNIGGWKIFVQCPRRRCSLCGLRRHRRRGSAYMGLTPSEAKLFGLGDSRQALTVGYYLFCN